jgi:hypothetical protein
MLDPMDRSSLRIQRYLDSAQRCQELALTVGSPNTRAALREAARRWRDVAEQIEENERKRTVLPSNPWYYGARRTKAQW